MLAPMPNSQLAQTYEQKNSVLDRFCNAFSVWSRDGNWNCMVFKHKKESTWVDSILTIIDIAFFVLNVILLLFYFLYSPEYSCILAAKKKHDSIELEENLENFKERKEVEERQVRNSIEWGLGQLTEEQASRSTNKSLEDLLADLEAAATTITESISENENHLKSAQDAKTKTEGALKNTREQNKNSQNDKPEALTQLEAATNSLERNKLVLSLVYINPLTTHTCQKNQRTTFQTSKQNLEQAADEVNTINQTLEKKRSNLETERATLEMEKANLEKEKNGLVS